MTLANTRSRRRGIALGVLLAGISMPGVAHADAAGPTDYRTEIVSVTPATDVVTFTIEGGDAFVRAEVEPGHELLVLGYDDEPYLRIDTDGAVFENVRSYATYYNEERYGGTDIPDIVDNTAAPEWERIGDGGAWSWHDHRAHFMGTDAPIGMEPGDAFPAQIVPVEVDGNRVEIEVLTTLLDEPSWLPIVIGALIAIQVVLLASLAGPATMVLAGLALGVLGTVVGVAQFRSVPPETEPLLTWWLMPALALAAAVATIVMYGRSALVQRALMALGGLLLALWAFVRRDGLTSALVPTDLPMWLDRLTTSACLVGGVLLVGLSVRDLFRVTPPG